RYFLFCHSIELLLKAYLARIGLTENQLQAFGHNITNLLEEAIKCGLSLSANARANIEQLTDAHTKHWPRYPMTTSAPIALIYQFEPDATELFEAVNAARRAALFRWPRIKPPCHSTGSVIATTIKSPSSSNLELPSFTLVCGHHPLSLRAIRVLYEAYQLA